MQKFSLSLYGGGRFRTKREVVMRYNLGAGGEYSPYGAPKSTVGDSEYNLVLEGLKYEY